MASSASTTCSGQQRSPQRQEEKYILEQCSFTGGKHNSFAMSVFLILLASSKDKPLTRSVMYELDAIALPQPKVLNLTSEMMPLASTRICSFMTSPHLVKVVSHETLVGAVGGCGTYAGAPTSPVPTSTSFLGSE